MAERIADVLAGPLEGVTRLVLRHERRRRLRGWFLIELPLWLAFMAVFLACLLVLALLAAFADGDGGFDDDGAVGLPWVPRLFHRWHEIVLEARAADGAVVGGASHAPADAAEGEALVASVLAAADREGLVVAETLGGGVAETLETWYGGQPLLAHPEVRDSERAAGRLRDAGYAVERGADRLTVTRTEKPRGRLAAGLLVALRLLAFPLLALRALRAGLASDWWDMTGAPPERYTITVHDDGRLTTCRGRDEPRAVEVDVDARDLLGIAYSATLGFDRDVTRRDPSLRLVTRDATETLPLRLTQGVGRALRDLVVAEAAERWAGVPGTTLRPTRCPYCGNLYAFAPGANCPSCGAPPTR